MDFGRPNVEIGRKMTNGRLLFLALMFRNVTMGTIQTKNATISNPQTTTTNKLDKHSRQLIMRSLNEHKLSSGVSTITALDPMVRLIQAGVT